MSRGFRTRVRLPSPPPARKAGQPNIGVVPIKSFLRHTMVSSVLAPLPPQKILVSIANENFYLLPLHSSLFTQNAPENFEVRSNSEEVRSESYIGSDLSPNAPPEQANPNCFVTTELFGFVFYFDYPY